MIVSETIESVGSGAPVPKVGLVITTLISLASMGALAVCLRERLPQIKNWRSMVITQWLILAIYTDSTCFVAATAILSHGFGLNSTQSVCSAAIFLCLACYMSTKVMIYYFLVEKAYIVSGVKSPRMRTKAYLFNTFGMLGPYIIVIILNFVWRIARFNSHGVCIIGMKRKAMLPLIIFDVVVNVYLTALFVIPLRNLYTYKNNPNSALRVITFRTFVGSLATLTSSVINLTIIMILHGEPAWICLMFCSLDILFSTIILHWVTSKDSLVKAPATRGIGTTEACRRCTAARSGTLVTAPSNNNGTSAGTGSECIVTTISTSNANASPSEEKGVPYNIFDRSANGRRKSSTKSLSPLRDLEDNNPSVHVRTDITWLEENV